MPILSAVGGDAARNYGLTSAGRKFKGGDVTTTDLLTMTKSNNELFTFIHRGSSRQTVPQKPRNIFK